jgi:hypothetical protein
LKAIRFAPKGCHLKVLKTHLQAHTATQNSCPSWDKNMTWLGRKLGNASFRSPKCWIGEFTNQRIYSGERCFLSLASCENRGQSAYFTTKFGLCSSRRMLDCRERQIRKWSLLYKSSSNLYAK